MGGAVKEVEATSDVDRVVALLGGKKVLKRTISTRMDAHRAIEAGIPADAITHFASHVRFIKGDAAFQRVLGISKRTVQRRSGLQKDKQLSKEQGSQVWRIAEIIAKATKVIGNAEAAESWLETPAFGLEGQRPVDLLSSSAGIEIVDTYLDQIEHSVFV